MTSVDNDNDDCKQGVCEVRFKPVQAARRSFQNLKALAGELISKVKDSLIGESGEASSDGSASDGDSSIVERGQLQTVKENSLGTESATDHLSAHSTAILNSFVQNSWKPPGDDTPPVKMVHVRPRAPEGLREAPRFSNPWRYDTHH